MDVSFGVFRFDSAALGSFPNSAVQNTVKHYHSETDYENNDFVEGDPIWPLIRVLLRAYPDVGLREPLFKWFEHKTQERLILTGGKKPDDLLIQYNNALRSCGL